MSAGPLDQPVKCRAELSDEELLKSCKPHHRHAVALALQDLHGVRKESIIRLSPSYEDFICSKLLCDARDLSILYVFAEVTLWLCFSITMQVIYLPKTFYSSRVAAGLILHFIGTWIGFGERFILAMHYASHRSLFSARLGIAAKVLNNFPQLVLSNFFGMPCGAYHLHHCIMHHQANNFFPYDLSATTPYQRDSPLGFLHYLTNFMLHTILYLPFYAAKKRRFAVALGSVCCTLVYLTVCQTLFSAHPVVFFVSLGLSSAMGPALLMFGNFGQHMFIDKAKPDSNYSLTINLIAAPFNMTTFNDGYHIVHHLNSVLHWSEMPLHFIRNLDRYEEEGALVFRGLNYMEMGALVMSGQLEKLASYVVQLRPQPLSKPQLVQLLRERLEPVPKACEGLSASHKSIFGLNQLLWFLLWMAGFQVAAAPAFMVPIFAALSFAMS
uniref:Fatty acid desaturase domain-containing protein n=1 Tax=Chrysotila carterae TaxID=13221 RepID=A0A6S9QD96_CHRCT